MADVLTDSVNSEVSSLITLPFCSLALPPYPASPFLILHPLLAPPLIHLFCVFLHLSITHHVPNQIFWSQEAVCVLLFFSIFFLTYLST